MSDHPVVWDAGTAPTRGDIEAIAIGGRPVALTPALRAAVAEGHVAMRAALDAAGGRVYGVTTGQGRLADRDLTPDEIARHQHDLLLGRAVGSAPWLSTAEARALLAVRLARFASGSGAVSAELCAFIADRLGDGFTPAVPRDGVGCAGEVIPLAHAFQTLIGVGRVLAPGGGVEDAAAALAARGAAPYVPGPKEGIALLAGCPGTTALAIVRRHDAARLVRLLGVGAACSADAAGVALDALSPAAGRLSADPLLHAALADLARLLEGASADRPDSQGPVSFRVAPQIAAHLARALARLGESADRALASGDDSPALVDGAFVSTGAFHEVDLAADMQAMTLALGRAAELALQRVHRMLDGRVTGLPDQLTPLPGPRCGLVVVHKRAAGVVAALRGLGTGASAGAIDTSLGQEDVQTFGFLAAEELRRALDLTEEVLAIELLTARQAWWLRGRPPAPGLAAVAGPLIDAVPPVDADRPLGDDIDRVRELLASLA